jgi:hypothetical protein
MSGSEKSNTAAKSASLERQASIEPIGDAPGKKLRSDTENESEKGSDSSSLDSDIGNASSHLASFFLEFCMRVFPFVVGICVAIRFDPFFFVWLCFSVSYCRAFEKKSSRQSV